MSLMNSYEKKIAKNLLCVGTAGTPGTGADYGIPVQTKLYMGLLTDGGDATPKIVPQITASSAMNDYVDFDETNANIILRPDGPVGTWPATPYTLGANYNTILYFEPGPNFKAATTVNATAAATPTIDSTFPAEIKDIKMWSNGYYRIPLNACNVSDPGTTPATAQVAFLDVGGIGTNSIDILISNPTGIDTVSNKNAIKFNQATSNWGNIIGWFITDTAELNAPGTVYLMGYTNNNVPINANDRPIFNQNSLSFQIQ